MRTSSEPHRVIAGTRRSAAVEVVPVRPPTGAVGPERARSLEESFLDGFRMRVAEQRRLPVSPSREVRRGRLRVDLSIRDGRLDLARRLAEWGLTDLELLESLPCDGHATAEVRRRRRIPWPARRPPVLTITAAVVSPTEQLARRGVAVTPAGEEELLRVVRRHRDKSAAAQVIGVLSTTGWIASARAIPAPPDGVGLVLVSPGPHGSFRTEAIGDERAERLTTLFDPEDAEEKRTRLVRVLGKHSHLASPGGLVDLGDLVEELECRPDELESAVAAITRADDRLRVLELDGRRILKRDRF